jgi:hypothetical protein
MPFIQGLPLKEPEEKRYAVFWNAWPGKGMSILREAFSLSTREFTRAEAIQFLKEKFELLADHSGGNEFGICETKGNDEFNFESWKTLPETKDMLEVAP